MKTKLAALAVIASLALAGCSAGNQSAETAPSPTAASSAPMKTSATPSATPTYAKDCSEWVPPKSGESAEIMNYWLKKNGESCPRDISGMYSFVDSFELSDGVLEVATTPLDDVEKRYDIAEGVMCDIQAEYPNIERVKVEPPNFEAWNQGRTSGC
ncbi:hypothetical protein [Glutamicibacter arilaitensis]|uniref:hypothetical protein n=1 Tax=Glutamicibacter arilaitensis TaxID=256701 RepID=UPI003FD4DA7C